MRGMEWNSGCEALALVAKGKMYGSGAHVAKQKQVRIALKEEGDLWESDFMG